MPAPAPPRVVSRPWTRGPARASPRPSSGSTAAPAGRATAAGAPSSPRRRALSCPERLTGARRTSPAQADRRSIIPAMCEHYIARAAAPFRIDELWDFTARLERFGIAGFGWGASWVAPDGTLRSYRDVRAFADDPSGRADVGRATTSSLLVHLRRPSKLSTL